MTNSLMKWHLSRDNQVKLAKFCGKHQKHSEIELFTAKDDKHDYWQKTFKFDNGSFITAELIHGTIYDSYSVADHFQVVDYGFGK